MIHRHINTQEWTPMAIESLFDRGQLEDWKELVQAMKDDPKIARNVLRMAQFHEDVGSAALARLLVARLHPNLATFT